MMRRCILQWRDHAEATQLEIKMLWHHATCDIMTCRRLAWCMLFAHQADAAGGGCKCDGRGGGLTAALLCGIWCAAMLITASHHPPSLQIYHCLMIYPPSLPPPYPSPICSPPLCLIYFGWSCNMKQQQQQQQRCCRCDLWLQTPTTFVSHNSSF